MTLVCRVAWHIVAAVISIRATYVAHVSHLSFQWRYFEFDGIHMEVWNINNRNYLLKIRGKIGGVPYESRVS